jgi:peptidoglycan-N-acetylglucosamine deacetylase
MTVLSACGGGDDTAVPTALPSPTSSPESSATSTPPSPPSPAATPSSAAPALAPPTPATTPAPPAPDEPSSALPASLLGTDWTRIPTHAKVVALTFDAGGDPAGLPSIVATLRETGTTGTFFLTGSWIRAFPDQAREVARLGMPLGNHSDTHPHVPALTKAQIATELTAAEDSLRAVTGREFDPLFRFPFGDTTPLDIAVVNEQGYVCVRWTVDTLGWKGTSEGMDAAAVLDRVVQAATPGEIVLMHVGANPDDGSTLDADALPSVIRELRARGYRFVTLQALLQTPGS